MIFVTFNKAIVDIRFRPRCTTHDEHLVFIVEQYLAGIDAVVSAVTLLSCRLEIDMTRHRAHYVKT